MEANGFTIPGRKRHYDTLNEGENITLNRTICIEIAMNRAR